MSGARRGAANVVERLARCLRREDGPVQRYLEASVAHLAPPEREVVLSTPDDPPMGTVLLSGPLLPRVVRHRFGAFVNVPSDREQGELDALQAAGFPTLVGLIVFADRHGCSWINFDIDGAEIAELPLYAERPLPLAIASCASATRLRSASHPITLDVAHGRLGQARPLI